MSATKLYTCSAPARTWICPLDGWPVRNLKRRMVMACEQLAMVSK